MNTVTINGVTYQGARSVSVSNGRVIIDGKNVDHDKVENGILKVEVTGVLEHLEADGDVQAGSVQGTVQAGGDVSCDDVGGTVQCGGDVECGKISGSVMAGGVVTVR